MANILLVRRPNVVCTDHLRGLIVRAVLLILRKHFNFVLELLIEFQKDFMLLVISRRKNRVVTSLNRKFKFNCSCYFIILIQLFVFNRLNQEMLDHIQLKIDEDCTITLRNLQIQEIDYNYQQIQSLYQIMLDFTEVLSQQRCLNCVALSINTYLHTLLSSWEQRAYSASGSTT